MAFCLLCLGLSGTAQAKVRALNCTDLDVVVCYTANDATKVHSKSLYAGKHANLNCDAKHCSIWAVRTGKVRYCDDDRIGGKRNSINGHYHFWKTEAGEYRWNKGGECPDTSKERSYNE